MDKKNDNNSMFGFIKKEIKRLKKPNYLYPYLIFLISGTIMMYVGLFSFIFSLVGVKSINFLTIILLMVCGFILILCRDLFIQNKNEYERKIKSQIEREKIMENSILIMELNKLNDDIGKYIKKIDNIVYDYVCPTLNDYSYYDLDIYIKSIIKKNFILFKEIEDSYEILQSKYLEYQKSYDEIKSLAIKEEDCSKDINYYNYKKLEWDYYVNNKVNIEGLYITIIAIYNENKKKKTFLLKDFISIIKEINEKEIRTVMDTSSLIKEINKLNMDIDVYIKNCELNDQKYFCTSLYDYAHFDLEEYIKNYIKRNKAQFVNLEEDYEILKTKYAEYETKYSEIKNFVMQEANCPKGITYETYKDIEIGFYNKNRIILDGKTQFTLTAVYYENKKEKTFSYEELIDIINGINPPIMTSKRKKEKEIEDFVKDKSNLLQILNKINNNDYFYNFKYQKKYDIYCIKRLEYNEFDFDKELVALLRKDICGYENLLEQYRNNVKKYKKYCKEYVALKELSVKQETYSFEIDFNKFKTIENKFYTEWKKNPPVKPSIMLIKHYVTPQGRDSYEQGREFSLEEIILLLEEAKKPEMPAKKRMSRAQLEKKQAELEKREEELEDKTREFIKATKNHLYSPLEEQQAFKEDVKEENSDKQDHLYIKLKKLKKEFESGQISFDEYTERRNEIL